MPRTNFPDHPESTLDAAATAWVGAGRSCLVRAARGELVGEPFELAAFLVRWNLRGIGVHDEAIDQAIAFAEAAMAAPGDRKASPRADA